MPLLILVLLVFLPPLLFVVLLRFLARRWKKAGLSWSECMNLTGILVLLMVLLRLPPSRAFLALPPPLPGVLTVLFIALIGGWCLQGRGLRADGRPFAFADGALLAGAAALGVALLVMGLASAWINVGPMRMMHL